MALTSITYILFLLSSLVVYYLVPKKTQWIVLLIASIIFFVLVGNPWTIVYVILGIIATWLCSNKITKIKKDESLDENKKRKYSKIWLILGLVIDVGLLSLLKYTNFLLSNFCGIYNLFSSSKINVSVNWPAALGISFYTLQIVGYLLDSYWGISESQPNVAKFALFTVFFPQMVSGPICRYNDLKEQLYVEHKFDVQNLRSGIIRITVGFCKKLLVANTFAVLASNLLDKTSGLFAFIGMICYVVEIYADFSGCMDIVLGTAQCFDIKMVENFKSPFRSKTIQEFWRNWHITLGLWLRDYIMYPILRTKTWNKLTKKVKNKFGKRASKLIPTHLAMLILWLFMGLWHGGGWNFILEGIWFWLVIVIGEWMTPVFKKITDHFDEDNFWWTLFRRCRTILIYAIGALMFRAQSIPAFFETFKNIFFVSTGGLETVINIAEYLPTGLLCFLLFYVLTNIEYKHESLSNKLKGKPFMFRILVVFSIIYITILLGCYGSTYNAADFIYGGF